MSDYEAKLRFKRQARHIAQLLAKRIAQDETLDFVRAGGDAVCPLCGLDFYLHPQLDAGPVAGLVIACDGSLLKL